MLRSDSTFLGRLTPREEKLAENIRLEKKKNAKLSVQIENAEFRVDMEMNHRIQFKIKITSLPTN